MIKLLLLIIILYVINLSCNCIEGFKKCPEYLLDIENNCKIDSNGEFINCDDETCRNKVEIFYNNCSNLPIIKESNNKYNICINSGYDPNKNSPKLNTTNFKKCSFYLNKKQTKSNEECIKNSKNKVDNYGVCEGIENKICQSEFPTTTINTNNLSNSVNSNCINCKMDKEIRNMVCECKNDNLILPLSLCDENMKNIEYINGKLVKKICNKFSDNYRYSSIQCPYNSYYDSKDNICYSGGIPFKKKDKNGSFKLYLSMYDNKELFLQRLKNAYNSETGNGILLSMSVVGSGGEVDDNVDQKIKFRMDGSGCIIRKNIYDKIFFPIAGTMFKNIWMGYIWDTNFKIDKLDCLYQGDANTSASERKNRCAYNFYVSSYNGSEINSSNIKCINNNKCIEQLFEKKRELNKFIDENFNLITENSDMSDNFVDILRSKYNEIVFLENTYTYGIKDEDGLFNLYLKDIIPSALVLCYKTSITDDFFNLIGWLLNDSDKEIINHYKEIYHPSTYVVIISINIDSYPISSFNEFISYGIINEIEDITTLEELTNYF